MLGDYPIYLSCFHFICLYAGTTCATILTRAIFAEGCKSVAAGMNAMDLRRGISMAVDSVVTNLKSRARMISTSEEIAQVFPLSHIHPSIHLWSTYILFLPIFIYLFIFVFIFIWYLNLHYFLYTLILVIVFCLLPFWGLGGYLVDFILFKGWYYICKWRARDWWINCEGNGESWQRRCHHNFCKLVVETFWIS